jgi:hypothetical protein
VVVLSDDTTLAFVQDWNRPTFSTGQGIQVGGGHMLRIRTFALNKTTTKKNA